MKIGLAQLNPRVGDLKSNAASLLAAYQQAVLDGAQLVLSPELSLPGYPPRDLVFRESFVPDQWLALEELAKSVGSAPFLVGLVTANPSVKGKPFYNSVAVLHEGRVAQLVHKRLLPNYDVFEEERFFEPGASAGLFEFQGLRLGICVCEDIWDEAYLDRHYYDVDPVAELVAGGATMILNLSASPFLIGKPAVRETMLKKLAQEHGVPVVYCNAVGANDHVIFDGHSIAIAADGTVLARVQGFETSTSVFDSEAVPASPLIPSTEELEQIHDALVLGVRDYIRKCGFKTCLLGLSGGIDSALVAVLASRAIGPENVYGVSMPSQYSSDHSKDDARDLAKNLGMPYSTVAIEPIFAALKGQLAPSFEGRAEDVTEENMQSRSRGLILMSLSNKFGHLLLSTGNKSEMTVGYCTIYGDMCGGLSVISDLPKTKVFELCRWINREEEIIPWSTIEKPPSAELRPDQKDQDTLPPYEILDAIIEGLIDRSESCATVASKGFDLETVKWVQRRIEINEWKRQQAALGLKLTAKAFGMGRRFPIVQRYEEV